MTAYPPAFRLREIKQAVPSSIEPDLKNLEAMDWVWDMLDLVDMFVEGVYIGLVLVPHQIHWRRIHLGREVYASCI